MKKKTLDRADLATIKTTVSNRVKKLVVASPDPAKLADARNTLISTARIKGASQEALDEYARYCADELVGLTTGDSIDLAREAMLILRALDNVNTCSAFGRALASSNDFIRYTAARGIQDQHKRLAARKNACLEALADLARAGAAEGNEVALRKIYEAIDFSRDVPDFKYCDEAAAALCIVFESRLAQLAEGRHDEWKDEAGFAAAARCYAGASQTRQRELREHMAGFVENLVSHYFEDGATAEYQSMLRGLNDVAEKELYSIMRTNNMPLPNSPIELGKGGKARQKAEDALKDLKSKLGV